MLHTLKEGQRVKVWPMPGLRVKVAPDHVRDVGGKPTLVEQRVLSAAGEEVTWSLWWHDLARGGAVAFSDPSVIAHATHQRHPHEWVADFKKPAMHLTDDELALLLHRKPLDQLSDDEKSACDSHIAWHLVDGARDARDAKAKEEAAAKAKAEAAESARAAELRGVSRPVASASEIEPPPRFTLPSEK